jgi:hypothetical protein
MNSPERLFQSCQHPEARELLRAGMAEAPRPSAKRAAALVLGIGAAISVTSAAGAATASVATATATATASAVAAPSIALLVGKWIALGTVAGLALAGGANALSSPAEAPQQQAAAPVLPALQATPAVAQHPTPPTRNESASAPAAAEAPTPLPASPNAKPAAEPAAASPAVAANLPSSAQLPDGRDLGREVAQIDAARRAVAAGNAGVALSHLDQYAALDRTSTLDREAQLLRIDALLLSGRKAEALRLAQGYLALHPGDPHSTRLRALVQAP